MSDQARLRAYFAALPPKSRRALGVMRTAIRAVAPGAVQVISYRIPAFKVDGRMFVWYAAFTNHCSLFPMTGAIRRAFAKPLKGYETSKGTIRFSLDRPIPVTLVKRLLRARLAEVRKARVVRS